MFINKSKSNSSSNNNNGQNIMTARCVRADVGFYRSVNLVNTQQCHLYTERYDI